MKDFPTAPRWFAQVLKAENLLLKKFKNHLPTQAELHNQDDKDINDFSYNADLDLMAAERMVPGKNYSPYMVQHVARYLWAMSFCRGKTVVDLGCGDGYGTYMLSWVSEQATGVDISPKAIQESIQNYGSKESWATLTETEQAAVGLDLELPNNSWAPVYKIADLTEPQTLPDVEFGVCFEVLEHLDNPQEILNSIAESNIETVLFSVPNPLAGGSHINPHHVNDWSLGMLKGYFRDAGAKEIKTYRQGLKRYQIKRGATYADLNWLFRVRFK